MNPSALQQATQAAQAPQGMPTPQVPQNRGAGGASPQMAQALQALMTSQGGQAGGQQGPQQQPQMPQQQPQAPQEPQFKDPNQQGGMSAELLMKLMQNPQLMQQLIHMGVFGMVNGRLMLHGMQPVVNQAQEVNSGPSQQTSGGSTPDQIQSFQQAPQQSSMGYPGVNIA